MVNMGHIIEELRRQHDMTQEELASKIGKSKQLISLYEADKRRPSYETLEALADLFNVPMQTFLTKEEQDAAIRDHYASIGVATRVDSRRIENTPAPRTRSALDKIITQLTEYRDAIPEGLRPDEERLLMDYRMLGPKGQAKLRKWLDIMLDEE